MTLISFDEDDSNFVETQFMFSVSLQASSERGNDSLTCPRK